MVNPASPLYQQPSTPPFVPSSPGAPSIVVVNTESQQQDTVSPEGTEEWE
jgi:hypothetical protein